MRFEEKTILDWKLEDTLTVGYLIQILKQFPSDMPVLTTWENTIHSLTEDNIYITHENNLYIDADENFHKDDLAK